MSPHEQRDARSITLGDLFLLFVAHGVGVVELLKELVRVLNPVDAEVQVIDVLITGPQSCRFVRRVGFVRCQREVRFGAGDFWRFWFAGVWSGDQGGARTEDIETKYRRGKGKVNDGGCGVTPNARAVFRHDLYAPK